MIYPTYSIGLDDDGRMVLAVVCGVLCEVEPLPGDQPMRPLGFLAPHELADVQETRLEALGNLFDRMVEHPNLDLRFQP